MTYPQYGAIPTITSVQPTAAQPYYQVTVTGLNFGFVDSVWFVDPAHVNPSIIADQMQVGSSQLITATIPPGIVVPSDPADSYTYEVVAYTIENVVSVPATTGSNLITVTQSTAMQPPLPTPTATGTPYPLAAWGTSVGLDRLRSLLRSELSDDWKNSQSSFVGDGLTTVFTLPVHHLDTTTASVLSVPNNDPTEAVTLAQGSDYILDAGSGTITLMAAPATGTLVVVSVNYYRFFDPARLDTFIQEAFEQVTYGRAYTEVTVSEFGYRQYEDVLYTFDTLPEPEYLPTAILAKTFALWVLATDAAYNIDVQEDGASIPRSQLYAHLVERIASETVRYLRISQMLNIGIERIEMFSLRRISLSTGRLVPLYKAKEYEDFSLPIRVLPGIDTGAGEGETFIDPWYVPGYGYGGGFGP